MIFKNPKCPPKKGKFIILFNFINAFIHNKSFISKFSYQRSTLKNPPHAVPQSQLQLCLILLLFFFFLAFFLFLTFFFLLRIFFWFFIFTTTILLFIHMMTKLLHPFNMAIFHVVIPSIEPFIPPDNCLCTHCS